jgi:hypothetical protein
MPYMIRIAVDGPKGYRVRTVLAMRDLCFSAKRGGRVGARRPSEMELVSVGVDEIGKYPQELARKGK